MFKRMLGRIFGGAEEEERRGGSLLSDEEFESIGTEADPMRDYDAASERNFKAMEAEQRGDVERAIELYESCVAAGYVQSHPYERLAELYERRGDPEAALRVLESFVSLAKSGRMPRGSQRSADRKRPEVESRTARLRGMVGGAG